MRQALIERGSALGQRAQQMLRQGFRSSLLAAGSGRGRLKTSSIMPTDGV
jgi:hypothetical protein